MHTLHNRMGRLFSATSLGVLLSTATLTGRAEDVANQNSALSPFQGAWEATSYFENGTADEPSVLQSTSLRVEGDRSTFTRRGQIGQGRYVVDDSKHPGILDIHVTSGPEKNSVLKCLYKFDGDALRIALGGPDQPRPMNFEPADGVRVEVWRRVDQAALMIARDVADRLEDATTTPRISKAFSPRMNRGRLAWI